MVAMRDKQAKHHRLITKRSDDGPSKVTQVARKAWRTVKQASEAVGQTLKEEGDRFYEKQKDRATGKVDNAKKFTKQVAHALHAVKADKLATQLERMTDGIEGASRYLEDSDLQKVLEDTREIVRNHEALAAASLFLIGFGLSRFLKAGAAQDENEDDD